jgi:hypothetical protein
MSKIIVYITSDGIVGAESQRTEDKPYRIKRAERRLTRYTLEPLDGLSTYNSVEYELRAETDRVLVYEEVLKR